MTHKLIALALPFALALLAGEAAGAVTAEKAERVAPDRVLVTWSDNDPVDVFVTDRPDAGVADAKLVSDDNRTGRFELPAGPTARPYILLRDGGDGRVARVAERVLPLQQGSNFRDLGGYAAAGGKRVRWGMIFRSGATPMLTGSDLAMIKALGLKDLVDLRSSEERSLAPTRIEGVRYTAVGYSMGQLMGPSAPLGDERMRSAYRQFPTLLAPQLKVLFEELLAGAGPVAYNCSAGQDRTGFATALVLSALGTPRDVIIADYHLSTTYRRPEFEMPRLDPAAQPANSTGAFFARLQQDGSYRTPRPLLDSQQHSYLEAALAEVESRYGSVEAYLDKELGVNAADLAKLRAMYLE
ncbi:MAG TPA: tyrosine-protein phosphatase [Phenylobacterium sp.]|nr:tyrosine-protein phosphatase [Phenylobacterium sp.]